MQDLNTFPIQAKPKLPLPHLQWPGALKIKIPHTFRPGSSGKRSRSKKPRKQYYDESSSITGLQTSFNPMDGVRTIRRHRWHWLDIQYPALAGFMILSLVIAPMPIFIKIAAPLLSILVCLMPATRQFFLPSMPIWIYLLYFFSSRLVLPAVPVLAGFLEILHKSATNTITMIVSSPFNIAHTFGSRSFPLSRTSCTVPTSPTSSPPTRIQSSTSWPGFPTESAISQAPPSAPSASSSSPHLPRHPFLRALLVGFP